MPNKKQRSRTAHTARKRDAKREKTSRVDFARHDTSFNFGALARGEKRRGSRGGAFGS